MTRRNVNLGKLGEEKAVKYLQKHGYQILVRNFRVRWGEIDIIAQTKKALIFVEVKTRWSEKCGRPEEAVGPRKIKILKRTAQYFKMSHPKTPDLMMIDVIAIELDSLGNLKALRHFKNITQ